MAGTKNSLVFEKVLDTLVDVSARNTSTSYALLTLDTAIGRLKKLHKVLNNVELNTSGSSSLKPVRVLSGVDLVSQEEIGKAISALIDFFASPLGAEKESFLVEFKGYLGKEYLIKIQNMGVNI